MEKEKIYNLISKYTMLNEQDKKAIDNKISDAWLNVFISYAELCNQDKSLKETALKLIEMDKVLNFNLTNDRYQKISAVYNANDIENIVYNYEFDEKQYKKDELLAKNWDMVEKRILEKINKVKNQKVLPFKEKILKMLNKDLEIKQERVKYYNESIEKQKQKEEMERQKPLYDKLNQSYTSSLKKYAKQAVDEFVEKNPLILCTKHTSHLSLSNVEMPYPTNALNEYANSIRDDVIKSQNKQTIKEM